MKPLTPEQRQLVEANHRIAYMVAYRMARRGEVTYGHVEDAVQEAMIGLMNAAKAYDPSRGVAFSTLAVWCARNQIKTMLRYERRYNSISFLRMDDAIPGGDGESVPRRWVDAMPAEDDTEAEAVNWLAEYVRRTLETCGKAKHARLLMANAGGRSMDELAHEHGVTRQMISKQIKLARKVLLEVMDRDEWRC